MSCCCWLFLLLSFSFLLVCFFVHTLVTPITWLKSIISLPFWPLPWSASILGGAGASLSLSEVLSLIVARLAWWLLSMFRFDSCCCPRDLPFDGLRHHVSACELTDSSQRVPLMLTVTSMLLSCPVSLAEWSLLFLELKLFVSINSIKRCVHQCALKTSCVVLDFAYNGRWPSPRIKIFLTDWSQWVLVVVVVVGL